MSWRILLTFLGRLSCCFNSLGIGQLKNDIQINGTSQLQRQIKISLPIIDWLIVRLFILISALFQSWMWLCGPLLIYVCDSIYRYYKCHKGHVSIVNVIQHPCDVIEICLFKTGFSAHPGQVGDQITQFTMKYLVSCKPAMPIVAVNRPAYLGDKIVMTASLRKYLNEKLSLQLLFKYGTFKICSLLIK